MDNLVGKRLDGRYELREIIGVGGMAVVYKAYDSIDDRIVAVKILKEEFVRNDEFRRRFKNESKAIAVLSHPNIVKVFDVSFGDNLQYIVMEHINGIPLKRFIERRGVLSVNDACHFTVQILRALQHAHEKGIVHRDIKPQNIMLLQDGTIKVTDFGIARFATGHQRTMTDQAIGSVHYISPEQARGDFTDGKADIYSVGVMLYEMLTGRVPFEADSPVSVAIMQLQSDPRSPRSINPDIPPGLEQITLRAMQKNPQMRYHSAAEMLADLEAFRENPDITFHYNVFVDDSPTKYVTGGKAEDLAVDGAETEEEAREKVSMLPILGGVAAALVIIIGVVVGILWKTFVKPDPVGELIMPNLVGLNINDVKTDERYADYKFNLEVVSYVDSDEYDVDIITKQEIKEGTKIKPGAKVQVWVSLGPKLVEVPSVKEYDQNTAIETLKALGFETKTVLQKDELIPVGRVIKTDPAEGSRLKYGTEITVYVSLGPESVPVEVPNVVGLTLEDAEYRLYQKGLQPKVKYEPSATVKIKDVVLSQEPASGTLMKGATVTLIVSNGESPVVEYNVKIPMELPDYYSQFVTVHAVINDKVEWSSPVTYSLAEGKTVTINLKTTLESADIIIAFSLPSDRNVRYPWMKIHYNFKENREDYTQREYFNLPSHIFYQETSSEPSQPGDIEQ